MAGPSHTSRAHASSLRRRLNGKRTSDAVLHSSLGLYDLNFAINGPPFLWSDHPSLEMKRCLSQPVRPTQDLHRLSLKQVSLTLQYSPPNRLKNVLRMGNLIDSTSIWLPCSLMSLK
jgi:hypothetical protein